jgi:tripartite ATP-independent transporter DctM subunit
MSAPAETLDLSESLGNPSPGGRWNLLEPINAIAATLMLGIVLLLLAGVASRYLFNFPVVWIDEVCSISFIWVAMLGSAMALDRNEHLRLTLFVNLFSEQRRNFIDAFGLVVVAAVLVSLLPHAVEYTMDEWFITTPALGIPNSFRVAAIPFGIVLMLALVIRYAFRSPDFRHLLVAFVIVGAIGGLLWHFSPQLVRAGNSKLLLFLVLFVSVSLACGVPIAFCFAVGTISYLAFGTTAPLSVVIGRMDEGMSSIILLSVPVFLLLGCILDATGMGKAIVDFLASWLGHIRAGMSYVLLGSLFVVSGISGSKVSDMATVAPALFPEMKRRGNKPREMIALLATGAAMADTVPPSIVLIVLGSVAGVSIAALFTSGFAIAMVLLLGLAILARWKARHEDMSGVQRPSLRLIGRTALIAAPALVLPFLIRSTVSGGVATATEVSTIAVLYAAFIGVMLYGGISLRKSYAMLVETAALTGSILLILGTASAMAWAITQAGIARDITQFMASMPGGYIVFMILSIVPCSSSWAACWRACRRSC